MPFSTACLWLTPARFVSVFHVTSRPVTLLFVLIVMKQTVIDQYCPAFLKKDPSSNKCTAQRYRQYNGLCNNLEHPYWGAALTPYRRLLQPDYADGKWRWGYCWDALISPVWFNLSLSLGVSEPRMSAAGKELPTTRHISAVHHRDMGYHDHAVTVFLISWGQAIDHDMTFSADVKGIQMDIFRERRTCTARL